MQFCLNISYKLERDFTLDFSDDWVFNNGTKMKIGINKVREKEVEIREIFTKWNGLCYAILSNLFLKWNINYRIGITYLVSFEFSVLISRYITKSITISF